MRTTRKYNITNPLEFKLKLYQWSQHHDEVVWLDSNDHKGRYHSYDVILAVDALTSLQCNYDGAFEQLSEYQKATKDWIFGYLSYDLKNDIEDLSSEKFDGLGFPDLYFFQPKKLFLIRGNTVELRFLNLVSDEIQEDFNSINKTCLLYTSDAADD